MQILEDDPGGIKGLTCLKNLHMWECEALEVCPLGVCTLVTLDELDFMDASP